LGGSGKAEEDDGDECNEDGGDEVYDLEEVVEAFGEELAGEDGEEEDAEG
jgi:hypothetical protein